MKAESSLSKGCLTTRKVVADSRNCCLSATSFGFKVKICSTANRLLLITPIRKEYCQYWDHPIAKPPTLIGEKRLSATLCIGVRCSISTCSNWISLIVLPPTTDKACDKSMKTCKKNGAIQNSMNPIVDNETKKHHNFNVWSPGKKKEIFTPASVRRWEAHVLEPTFQKTSFLSFFFMLRKKTLYHIFHETKPNRHYNMYLKYYTTSFRKDTL